MGLADDLERAVTSIFASQWAIRHGQTVPDTDDIRLGNDGVNLDATVLYADLAESTSLVTTQTATFAAEVYKAYLYCAARIISAEGGSITAYDGDRIMAVFIGGYKNTSAARAALKINYSVNKIINPRLSERYPSTRFQVRQAVGIDTSQLLVARTGVRGSNDLVWVGRAANYAAKLCGLRDGNYASYITAEVYEKLDAPAKMSNGRNMWESVTWTSYNLPLYRSHWQHTI